MKIYQDKKSTILLAMTIYQDNKSMILLAENGRSSSSKRTCHINVWYYFVTDKIKKVRSK